MRHLIPALVVAVLGFSTARAAPATSAPFSNKSYGDGGGYKHPDAAVGQFFEAKLQSPADYQRAAAISARPRPRPFAPVKTVGAASGALDSASEDARRDYETRLLGAAPEPRRQGLLDSKVMPPTDPIASGTAKDGMLFVSLELDPQEAGALRDAVAGLGAAAAFRPDARFQPMPGMGGLVRISGWLPVSRLGDAIARPGVKRVEVERGFRPIGDIRLTGRYFLKLRVADAAHPKESIATSVRELTTETGFKLERVFGLQTVPGDGAISVVSGTMPISRLSRALGLPGVIGIDSTFPTFAEHSAAAPPGSPAAKVRKEGFLKFVMARSLWLVLLTFFLALPAFGRMLKSGLAVFVPYR